MSSPLEIAISYIKRGWVPVPVPYRSKAPPDDAWQTIVITVETAPRHFNGQEQNVGVRLGAVSGGLADVDLDCPEAIALAPAFLPNTHAVFGRASKRRSHRLYVTDLCNTEDKAAFQYREPKAGGKGAGPMIVELRIGGGGKGAQTVFPGSTHESGEPITWGQDGEPARVGGTDLKRTVDRLAAASLILRRYPAEGSRHDVALTLGGVLARANWPARQIEKFVVLIARAAGDPEWQERGRSAAAAVALRQKGVNVRGLPTLASDFGKGATDKLVEWLGLHGEAPLLDPPPPTDGPPPPPPPRTSSRVSLDDFHAYMIQHTYIFTPSGETWPGASVNGRIPPIYMGRDKDGEPKFIPASRWLDENRPVEQMTWVPGDPQLIRGRLITGGGWIDRPDVTVFNLYRPPTLVLGDPSKAGPWLDHVRKVYPDDAGHIVKWNAHRVQRPQEKINHALVLGGKMGIGKDTILEPVKRAVGPWNFADVSPQQLLGRFNGFLKSVILRVSEARDLGEVTRYQFYDHLKAIIAAPPDVLRVDEKHLREYNIPNVPGVTITTNHKTDGIYLPADDRRHYVAWSELTKEDFDPNYWIKLWGYYEDGGYGHVAAYLAAYDLTGFDPKAPPPKTQAFWDIVDANRAPEDSELADVIDALSKDKDASGDPMPPIAFTLAKVLDKATELAPKDKDGNPERNSFAHWLADRKNRRQIPYRFEQCSYSRVGNDAADDGLWKIKGKRQAIYALANLSLRQRLDAAKQVIEREGETAFDLELFGAGR